MKYKTKIIITILIVSIVIVFSYWGIKTYKEVSETIPASETIEKDGLIIVKTTGKPFSGRIEYKSKNLDSIGIYKDGKIIQSIIYDKTATSFVDRFLNELSKCKIIYILPITVGVIILLINLYVFAKSFRKDEPQNSKKLLRVSLMVSRILMFLLFIFGFLAVSLGISTETARRFSCRGYLKQIGLSLRMYSSAYDGEFPHLDGAEGLDLLRKTGFLDYPLYFTCPCCNTKPAKSGTPITEAHLDYIYRGGYSEKDAPKIGILYDKKGNHYKFGNILFIDGSCKGFYGDDWQKNINPAGINNLIKKPLIKDGEKLKTYTGRSKENSDFILEIKCAEEYDLNDQIKITAAIENKTEYVLSEYDLTLYTNSCFPFLLVLTNSKGEKIDFNEKGKSLFTQLGYSGNISFMAYPGAKKSYRIDLTRIYDITEAGIYYLNISRKFCVKKPVKGELTMYTFDDSPKPVVMKDQILSFETLNGKNVYENGAIVAINKIPIKIN